jgi:uncharacterized protein (TIGR02145 family)
MANIRLSLALLIAILFLYSSCTKEESNKVPPPIIVHDVDGNVYHGITLGNKVWMVENLHTTRYGNGDSIPNATTQKAWMSAKSGAQCTYNNVEHVDSVAIHGRLYNGYALSDSRRIAPIGWHIATDTDWKELEAYLIENGYNYDGSLKDNKIAKSLASNSLWDRDYVYGTVGSDLTRNNKSGFAAFPSGYRDQNGLFNNIGKSSNWWTSSTSLTLNEYTDRYLYSIYEDLKSSTKTNNFGLSIRCVKD